jgi:hypothetical protein
VTTLVRGLLAAPVAALVAWAAEHGVQLDGQLVGAVLAAVVTALVAGSVHWAEARWPALGRAVAWLARQRTAADPPPPST